MSRPAASRAPRAWLARATDWIVPEANPSGAIYGLVLVGALLAAESGHHESYLDTIASAAITAALYLFAHAYAEILGRRLSEHERLRTRALARELTHDLAILRGAALPLLVLAIGWVAGAAQQTAVTAALWSVIASLIAFELSAGIRAHASTRELLLEGAAGATMGLAILALKIVLH